MVRLLFIFCCLSRTNHYCMNSGALLPPAGKLCSTASSDKPLILFCVKGMHMGSIYNSILFSLLFWYLFFLCRWTMRLKSWWMALWSISVERLSCGVPLRGFPAPPPSNTWRRSGKSWMPLVPSVPWVSTLSPSPACGGRTSWTRSSPGST